MLCLHLGYLIFLSLLSEMNGKHIVKCKTVFLPKNKYFHTMCFSSFVCCVL